MRYIGDLALKILGTEEEFNSKNPSQQGRYHHKLGSLYLKFWALLGVLLTLSLVLLFSLSHAPMQQEEKRKYRYTDTYQHVNDGQSDYVLAQSIENEVGRNDKHGSATEQLKEKNAYIKEARDLNAQEGMWRAANALVMLTLIQVFVGAITIIFLLLTLRTQRGELREARNVTKSQRAYVALDRFEWNPIGEDAMVIHVHYKNFGLTPAVDVRMSSGAAVRNAAEGRAKITINTHYLGKDGGNFVPQEQPSRTSIVLEEDEIVKGFVSGAKSIDIAIRCKYSTIFEDCEDELIIRNYHLGSTMVGDDGRTKYAFDASETQADIREEDQGPEHIEMSAQIVKP